LKLNTGAIGLLILVSFCCPVELAAQRQINKTEIIKQAGQSYYGLRKAGLLEFQARVTPTWEVSVKGIESHPEALKLLKGLKFSMTLTTDDRVNVSYEASTPAPNATVEAGFKQIFSGVEKLLSGFFDSWNLFMLNSPLPQADREYELKDLGSTYLLTYRETDADVTITMTKDFSITELKVISPRFKSSILPQFTKTEGGFVLTGYSANYVPIEGPGKVELNLQIDYQNVNGLKLPRTIRVHSTLDAEPNETELTFGDYQVKTR
jgi:hypothetical protein